MNPNKACPKSDAFVWQWWCYDILKRKEKTTSVRSVQELPKKKVLILFLNKSYAVLDLISLRIYLNKIYLLKENIMKVLGSVLQSLPMISILRWIFKCFTLITKVLWDQLSVIVFVAVDMKKPHDPKRVSTSANVNRRMCCIVKCLIKPVPFNPWGLNVYKTVKR